MKYLNSGLDNKAATMCPVQGEKMAHKVISDGHDKFLVIERAKKYREAIKKMAARRIMLGQRPLHRRISG